MMIFATSQIVAICSDIFDVSPDEIMGRGRTREIFEPRAVAMHILRDNTALSYPAIGRKFGRDHTTVINAIERVDKLAAKDELFSARFMAAKREVKKISMSALPTFYRHGSLEATK